MLAFLFFAFILLLIIGALLLTYRESLLMFIPESLLTFLDYLLLAALGRVMLRIREVVTFRRTDPTKQVFEASRDGDENRLTTTLQLMNERERTVALQTGSLLEKFEDGELEATPLTAAAGNGHLDCLEVLLCLHADVEGRSLGRFFAGIYQGTSFTFSPLFLAASNGHLDVVRCLVKHGANVNNVRSNDKCTPLMIASRNGHVNVVTFLVEHGANMDLKDTWGNNALQYAQFGSSALTVYPKLLTLYRKSLFWGEFRRRVEGGGGTTTVRS